MNDSPEVIYCEWLDSMSPGSSVWANKDEASGWNRINHLVRSVGFVLEETDDFLNIASHETEDQVSGQISIPKVAVTHRVTLRQSIKVRTK